MKASDKAIVQLQGASGLPVDPAIPQAPVLTGVQRPQNTLQMMAIAILLCCTVKALSPDLARQIVAAGQISNAANLLMLFSAWSLSVLWHEVGHLVAALLYGFDVAGVAFGPLRGSRIDGRWSIRVSGQSIFAASVSAIPHRSSAFDSATWRRGMLVVVAGGPIATFIAALASLLLLRFATLSAADACFYAFMAELNALIFLLGLVPNRPDSLVRNDASLYLALLRSGSEAHAILLYHLISQLKRQGFRPCFYPEHIVRAAARALAGPEFRVFFAQTVSEWALDRGRRESAEAWDRHALDMAASCSVRTYNQALAQAACLDLLLRQDWAGAAAKCGEVTVASLTPDWFRHRSAAVVLLTKRNILDAMGELQRAEFRLRSGVPYFEYQKLLIDWLRQTAKMLSNSGVPLPVVNDKVS